MRTAQGRQGFVLGGADPEKPRGKQTSCRTVLKQQRERFRTKKDNGNGEEMGKVPFTGGWKRRLPYPSKGKSAPLIRRTGSPRRRVVKIDI